MCSILSWKGDLPKGLLSALLIEAESRGKDSTGIAFREESHNVVYRQAVSAHYFVKTNNKHCGEARRSKTGIGHTRRASKGMPVNNINAHPFIFGKYIFAHNGKIDNWQDLKVSLINKYAEAAKNTEIAVEKTAAEKSAQFYRSIATDSMVLGEYISIRDFSPVQGCMGLTWICRDNVYCFRSNKELVGAVITWKEKDEQPENTVSHKLVLIASTRKIISEAISHVKGATFDYDFVELDENTVYRLEIDKIVSEGTVPVNPANHEDQFTSAEVVSNAAVPAAVPVTPVPGPWLTPTVCD